MSTLTGTWAIKAVDNQPLEGAPATIAFADDRVSGTTGCNRFSGSFQLAGNMLTLGALGTTRMACPPPLMQRETMLLARLSAPLTVSSTARGTVTLTGSGGETVVLARQ
ncbi:heat shock protein HslJ [Sphingomonas zeicaulis]|uniref:META domain-containing protein n=1 Tax=Sphingomonas zeicaulis TaxID=1632740 RepID=UPI003D1E1574